MSVILLMICRCGRSAETRTTSASGRYEGPLPGMGWGTLSTVYVCSACDAEISRCGCPPAEAAPKPVDPYFAVPR